MKIAPQVKSSLVDVVSRVLGDAVVSHGGHLDLEAYERLGESSEKLPRSVQEQLGAYIGDWPLANFVYDELLQELKASFPHWKDGVRLASLAGYDDAIATARRLVSGLESLPRRYTLSVEVPPAFFEFLAPDEDVLEISSGFRLVRGTALNPEFQPPFGLRPGNMLALTEASPLQWGDEKLFLQVDFSGYANSSGPTDSVEDAIEEVCAFLGSLLAHGIISFSIYRAKPESEPLKYAIHSGAESVKRVLQVGKASKPLTVLGDVRLTGRTTRLLGEPGGMRHAVQELLSLGPMLSKKDEQRLHGNLMLGSKWLLDSHIGEDNLLSYIQATVALETLLGDKKQSDLVGIGALLGNRCAYLIANSAEERKQLIDAFKLIYNVRSKIVHSGQSRLTLDEKGDSTSFTAYVSELS